MSVNISQMLNVDWITLKTSFRGKFVLCGWEEVSNLKRDRKMSSLGIRSILYEFHWSSLNRLVEYTNNNFRSGLLFFVSKIKKFFRLSCFLIASRSKEKLYSTDSRVRKKDINWLTEEKIFGRWKKWVCSIIKCNWRSLARAETFWRFFIKRSWVLKSQTRTNQFSINFEI